MVALVGESGCGKTTTAQAILRLVRADSAACPSTASTSWACGRTTSGHCAADADHLPGSVRVARPALPRVDDGGRAARHPPDRIALERRDAVVRALEQVGSRRPSSSRIGSRTSFPEASGSELRSPRASSSGPTCSWQTSPSRCSTSLSGPESSDPRRAPRPGSGGADDHARPLDGRAVRRSHLRHVPRPHRRGGARPRRHRKPQHPYTKALLSVVPRRDPRHRAKLEILRGETPIRSRFHRAVASSALPRRDRRVPRDRSGASCPAGSRDHRAACILV